MLLQCGHIYKLQAVGIINMCARTHVCMCVCVS